MTNNEMSIYIHIPFCEQKCNYCAFASFCANQQQIENYIEKLCQEIESRKLDKKVSSIYIGGGTPSILSESQIERIVKTIFDHFDVYQDAEFTIEANPNSINESKLKKWKSLGINRLSVGVQSLNDKSLKKIGRLHTKNMALEKIALACKFFDNVSADLIVGLEGETGKSLESYAQKLLELKVKHISCYLLEIYQNTKLSQLITQKKYKPLDDEHMILAFNKLSNFLQDKNLLRYEISNFCYDGFQSKHNLNYWARGNYLGFGLSAHSYIDGCRRANAETFEGYFSNIFQIENLSVKEEIEEIIMLGLRCNLGVDLKQVESLGYVLPENIYFKDYKSQQIIVVKKDKMFLNPLFYHLSNTIISNLIPD